MRAILHLSKDSKLQRIRAIQIRVCAKHRITVEELLSERRHKELVLARHEAMRLAYYETSMSVVKIARAFARHHCTVLYVIGRLNRRPRIRRELRGSGRPARTPGKFGGQRSQAGAKAWSGARNAPRRILGPSRVVADFATSCHITANYCHITVC